MKLIIILNLRWKELIKRLQKLKDEKVIKAIGVGINDSDICAKFAEAGDFDCMLLAGRYSLLDQNALNDFFPIAEKNNIGIILAGVFNSGILAKGIGENITYFYDTIPEEVKNKYLKISKICENYNVPVPAAAIQFSYSNKLISSMILGMDRPDQIKQNLDYLNFNIPNDLWSDLFKEKLIDERCPLL
jgi:D-threo-aldose 1-dehydrogenase